MKQFLLKTFKGTSHALSTQHSALSTQHSALSTQHSALSTQQTYELRHARQGFTLIELSIVLVIIGLIVGGVLVGQDLIKAAQVRSFQGQMTKIEQAVYAFKLKYNCLPGDCDNAATFGLGLSGNGDKTFGGDVGGVSAGCVSGDDPLCQKLIGSRNGTYITMGRIHGEGQYFWVHLGAAGLIESTHQSFSLVNGGGDSDPANLGNYFPKDALNKSHLVVFMWNNKLFIRTGLTGVNTVGVGTFGIASIAQSQMQQLGSLHGYDDVKVGTSGANYVDWLWTDRIVTPIGWNTTTSSSIPPGSAFSNCVESDGSGGYRYNLDGNFGCNVMYRIDY